MIERQIIEALNGSIDRLAGGQTVADCLRAYPTVADELRPLLEIGQTVSRARVSAAEIRAVRSRVDARITPLIEQTDFRNPRFRLSRASIVLLVAIVLMVLIGLALILWRGEQPQFTSPISPTLATETQTPTTEPTFTPSPTSTPTQTLTPTAAPSPPRAPTEAPALQQPVDESDTGPVVNQDNGAVNNQDDGAVNNQDDGNQNNSSN